MLRQFKRFSPYGMYIKIALAAGLLGIVGTHLWNDSQEAAKLSRVTRELGSLEQTNIQTLHTLTQNKSALKECLDANAWNALQAKDQEFKTLVALANVRSLEELNAQNDEDTHRKEAALRGRDEECRTADDPLPDWLLPPSLWDD